ncbi:hypothetical protein GY481_005333 [Escherichia coli]|nr:hypothetical protein [Escherichia coli]EFI4127867.1 hypothetical protein [Escherichia coli]EFI4149129.1 hypothetical protein [Escherichia coli]EFI4159577.1 hypothetical protein [Escherichia coli]EFI4354080.1 hypothetical protein [Escherichia coli]
MLTGKYWRDEIADGFTKTGVRLRFLLSCQGDVCYEARGNIYLYEGIW